MQLYRNFTLCFLFFLLLAKVSQAQPVFKVIPLGVKGGTDESNLSSYMLAPIHSDNYVCLDAGTLNFGLQQAVKNGTLKGFAGTILKNNVKGYLISHPHLDHVAGLIINSPDDSPKNIYALPFCIDVLKTHYFTWKNWANFANEGDQPTLKKYHYTALDTAKETTLDNTEMTVKPFLLSHSKPYQSTAFLIRSKDDYLLYLGDTGADEMEHAQNLYRLWQAVAPLINSNKLKAIFVETSFPDEQPTKQLFGHLTPSLLMKELDVLGKMTDAKSLKQVYIVITHMKPSAEQVEEKIRKELETQNKLNLKLVFPQQGKLLLF
ncbi:MAG: 3',5'-cyclic-nucleotide phosphodiesterase [Bacteroidetes bacterium]|nr:3',5'-cyclic-nucleotide phosphodiesterase [Bacteroidota bacterium]